MSRIWTRRDQLGIPLSYRIEMPDAGTAHAFFSLSDGNFMELVAPLGEGSPDTLDVGEVLLRALVKLLKLGSESQHNE